METRICSLIAGVAAIIVLPVARLESAGRWPSLPFVLSGMTAMAVFGVAIGSGPQELARLRAIGRGVIEAYKKIAVLVLNLVVCFACIELASTGIVKARSTLAAPEEQAVDPRSASSYYVSQSWAPLYWREFSASRRQRYRPYVLWRRGAFAGKTINIDDNGVRATPGATCGPQSLKVFVLGGSTVWGTGSPDWGTLPAYLQTELQRTSGKSACVVNYGESAYVSTQSVLQLLLQLQSGNVPDLVISYEGPNDVYSAYQSGKAGAHENLEQLVASFEGRRAVQRSEIGRFMRSTNLFGLTETLLLKVTHPPEEPPKLITYQTMGVDQNTLTSSVVKTYLGNYEIVDGLARKFGFDFRFFWPPYVRMGRKRLIPEELEIARRVDAPLDSLYQSVHRAVAASASKHPHLLDITGVFDDYPDLVWLDDMHVTPTGNQILAAKITSLLNVSRPSTWSAPVGTNEAFDK
ncbi:MAG: hypothetical protein C5B57_10015 [Blastocatellia bacterium]|nr:MAG: hypothetical protein C5B57_10015 [Blastocatellia bacterium]